MSKGGDDIGGTHLSGGCASGGCPHCARPMTIPFELQERVNAALAGLGLAIPEGFVAEVTTAADLRFGDYQTNAAMLLAKTLKTNPRQLATELAGKIDVADLAETPSVAGP